MHVQIESNQLKSDRMMMAQSMHPMNVGQKRIVVKENIISPKKLNTIPPSPNKLITNNKSPIQNSPSRVIVQGPNPRNIRKV